MSFNDAISYSDLTTEELETAFKSLKRNNAAGLDTIDLNIVLDSYDEIKDFLFFLFLRLLFTKPPFLISIKYQKSFLYLNQGLEKMLLTIGLFQFF